MENRSRYSSYYVKVEFDPNCAAEIKQFLLSHGFSVDLLSESNGERTKVKDANSFFLGTKNYTLDCVINSKGKFLSQELFDFFNAHKGEIRFWTMGSLY